LNKEQDCTNVNSSTSGGKNIGVAAHYDSDVGWGVGMNVHY